MEERIQKIIANSGLCSRRKAEKLIEEGRVKVNEKTITIGDKADGFKDKIFVDKKRLKVERKVYYLLNKPKGYISTASDLYDRKKITDLIKTKARIYPVGRLDRDVTGIIFLTNDGEFANRITHPRYEVKKTYVAFLDKPLSQTNKERLEKGIIMDAMNVKCKIRINKDKSVMITLHQGLHKVVKRLFKEVGYQVKELKRVRIGNVRCNVDIGKYRQLTNEEIKEFMVSSHKS